MSLRFYFDHHVPRAVCDGLRQRGVDVLTCRDDNMTAAADSAVLDRASVLGRVLVSEDVDLLVEANRRQRAAVPFAGIIYAHQQQITPGRFVADLELVAKACDPADLEGLVLYLPL